MSASRNELDDRHRQALVAEALQTLRPRLSAFVRARVPAPEVDDILQQAAVRAVEKATSLHDADRVTPWLFRVHRSVIADAGRKRVARAKHIVSNGELPEAAGPVPSEGCRCIVSQLGRLHGPYGSILNLVDVKGSTLSEAAAALGVSVNNAAVRLHRARRALRKRMLEHCGVTSARECADCLCVHDNCCAA